MRAPAIGDFREAARNRLPRFLFDYLDGGALDEVTLRRNVTDLQAISLRQRVLRDVSRVDPSVTLFRERLRLPVILAPIGIAGLCARRGEAQAARAAEAARVGMCLSTMSICDIDEVAAARTRPFWFQLYVMRDRGFMRELITRAAIAGCNALVFTVDMPVAGIRYRDSRSGLTGASGPIGRLWRTAQALRHPRWCWDVGLNGRPLSFGNMAAATGRRGLDDYFAWLRNNFDATIEWRDLELIRSLWKGPLVIKGIIDPEDAKAAAALGADAVIVSNHGGRQLDGALSTAAALPAIAEAVGDRLTVLADGGVRSGTDVVRLMALGARAVMIGRAWAFALAADGERGVAQMLTALEAEIRVAMALTGAVSVDDINHDLLIRRDR